MTLARTWLPIGVTGLMLLAAPPARAAQKTPQSESATTSDLRIVIVEGEDAVNIVQQKTAVAPVVEVRDRNDQPVAGAVVRFAIRSGHATFGGVRNLSVVTNATGRAVATGLMPTGNGALQIGASAAFQGQTAAITIAQTNVMTLAQAAAVTSAGASGGGAGAGAGAGGAAGGGTGGGLSTTTIGIVGGAAAAGTAVAVKELGGGGETAPVEKKYTGQFAGTLLMTFPGPPSCTRSEQQTATFEIDLTDNGGTVTGTAQVQGNINLLPGPCTPSTTDGFGFQGASVSGTTSNLTFTANPSNRFSGGGGSGLNAYTFSFTGTLSAGVITGTLNETRTITNDLDPSRPGTGAITYNVTLQ